MMAQSSYQTWTNYEKPKPVRVKNRNGKVKTIARKAIARKKKTSMVNMQDILSQLNGAVSNEPEVVEPTKTPKPASGTVSIATSSITIVRKKRGNKIVPVLEIELSKEQLRELGITD